VVLRLSLRWGASVTGGAILLLIRNCVLLLLASPVMATSVLDIPELGTKISLNSELSDSPKILRRVDGYVARIAVGSAVLTISRLDEAVPYGSTLDDERYRASLRQTFHDAAYANTREASGVIDGHRAWAIANAVSGPPGTGVSYSRTTYVIVDQHLYRLGIWAVGSGGRPADFDSATTILSGISFVSIDVGALPAGLVPSGLIQMPQVAPPKRFISYYPDSARRSGLEGIVDIEYGIDHKGHAQELRVQFSDSRIFDSRAEDLIRDFQYQVPSNWEAKGYQNLRFDMEVQFWLVAPGGLCPRDRAPRVLQADVATVCIGSR
jgi:TonB family protein